MKWVSETDGIWIQDICLWCFLLTTYYQKYLAIINHLEKYLCLYSYSLNFSFTLSFVFPLPISQILVILMDFVCVITHYLWQHQTQLVSTDHHHQHLNMVQHRSLKAFNCSSYARYLAICLISFKARIFFITHSNLEWNSNF